MTLKTREEMRADAIRFFQAAVEAADPAGAVRKALAATDQDLDPAGHLYVIGIGKAACPMVEEALAHVRAENRTALVITNYENVRTLDGCEVIGAGHPVPDENGHQGALRVLDCLKGAGEQDLVLVLMSGGGSALMPCPPEGVSLDDKIELTKGLLASGADITEINAVRKALSRLKGGGFLKAAAPARVLSLILSDVPGDDLESIASGPTVESTLPVERARTILETYNLFDTAPDAIRNHLVKREEQGAVSEGDMAPVTNILIGGNAISVKAAMDAASEAYQVQLLDDWLDGDVDDAAERYTGALSGADVADRPVAIVSGGETTVVLKGDGLGGRNQEMALRLACKAQDRGLDGNWVFLSAGTDGRDGPTEAAGALVDPGSLDRIVRADGNVLALLDNNDSNKAHTLSGDLVMTGGTGTNVADIQVLLISGS
ncbi:glycerate kinase type-2 family protein [Coralliovum pocilloporae]|uniref:glycerate kinase type-2 family protein n=1 Tax=Coralliovum pocilloporae TaxID=3066369 RepID=UPI0033070E2A